ncbi:hypothetical protein LRS13_15860 [Svornostia abyssi]|uniref:Secreted protein n=1 Tax=Svornostia abyssi TaxID=2898438 RepID=A0ABY5PCE9_9ACTN|nr:hypothetical protein LRS13_15860 [Parviterribacteraceae bacterium J379]
MDWWSSLSVEVLGGVATAVALAVVLGLSRARSDIDGHDTQVADLQEDLRRWLRDRDRLATTEASKAKGELASRGQLYSGAMTRALIRPRRDALHEWRDEATRKRRAYRAIADAEGWAHSIVRASGRPLPRLTLDDEQRGILAGWRAPVQPPGDETMAPSPVDDPTAPQPRT